MEFRFTGNGLKEKERAVQRFFEILPGTTSWTILIGMTALAFFKPLIAAIVMIAFYLYWLLKLLYLTIFLILSYFRLSIEESTDWMKRVNGLDSPEKYLSELKMSSEKIAFSERVSRDFHRKEVEALLRSGEKGPLSTDIRHLVIIPVAKETRDVIEPGIKSLLTGAFPPERIIVMLALEERASEEVKCGVEEVKEVYKGKFFDLLVAIHPDGVEGEAKAKGANTTFAARQAEEYLNKKDIPPENVICSCFDSDTVAPEQYFAALTYYFLISPDRTRSSFQPVPVYNNNIWEAPGLTRVLETGSSFFQLIEATNPQTLVTFSSHSMSFKALMEVGGWPVDMISDDSAIFWKAFIHFDGGYRVVPMYTTVSMDAVVAGTWWQTVINVYKQKRRWAWGVENFPILMRAFLADRKIPFSIKAKTSFKMFEGHISWATWAFLLTLIGWLPAIFAGREFSHSVLYYSAPRVAGTIFHLATFSLVTSMIISLLLLPRKKMKHSFIKRVGYALQWLLVPVTMVLLSAIPALDAQTRLLRAKYMTFWVTDKGNKKVSV